ncbi:MAG: hypothetical protein WCO53_15760 [Deltaproteobacteria bacterium]
MATQRFLKGLHLKRKPADAIAPGKIQKDVDVWLMSTRWWKDVSAAEIEKETLNKEMRQFTVFLMTGKKV